MKLVFLYGAPGVGKLTVARELSSLTGFPVFHNHLTVDMLAEVFGFQSAAFSELRDEFWIKVMTRAAQDGLPGLIFTFVFEPTVLPGFYQRLSESVVGAGGEMRPFNLRCDLAENERRVVQLDRLRFLKMTSAEVLRASMQTGVYEAPFELPGNVVIETTRLSAMQTAHQIAGHLQG